MEPRDTTEEKVKVVVFDTDGESFDVIASATDTAEALGWVKEMGKPNVQYHIIRVIRPAMLSIKTKSVVV